jgi:hypothetical protein
VMVNVFWDKERRADGRIHIITSEVYCETLEKMRKASHSDWKTRNADIRCSASPWQCASIYSRPQSSTAGAFQLGVVTTLLIALISRQATTTCSPTWRSGWDHSTSTIIRSWCKVSKRGWAHRRQTSLTQAYKNLFPNTIASIPGVTTLRSSLSIYVYLYIIKICLFLLLVLLIVAGGYFPNSPRITDALLRGRW